MILLSSKDKKYKIELKFISILYIFNLSILFILKINSLLNIDSLDVKYKADAYTNWAI